jgi:hypothetical protein
LSTYLFWGFRGALDFVHVCDTVYITTVLLTHPRYSLSFAWMRRSLTGVNDVDSIASGSETVMSHEFLVGLWIAWMIAACFYC